MKKSNHVLTIKIILTKLNEVFVCFSQCIIIRVSKRRKKIEIISRLTFEREILCLGLHFEMDQGRKREEEKRERINHLKLPG